MLLCSHQLAPIFVSGPWLPHAGQSVLRSVYLKMVVAMMEKNSCGGLKSEGGWSPVVGKRWLKEDRWARRVNMEIKHLRMFFCPSWKGGCFLILKN